MIKKKIPEAFESTEYRVPELKMVSPEVYELPSRKNFVNFIDEAYGTYRAKPEINSLNQISLHSLITRSFVRDYLQNQTPYRGLLLYHGLGVGKTCASIIAEAFKSNRDGSSSFKQIIKAEFQGKSYEVWLPIFPPHPHWFFQKGRKGFRRTEIRQIFRNSFTLYKEWWGLVCKF